MQRMQECILPWTPPQLPITNPLLCLLETLSATPPPSSHTPSHLTLHPQTDVLLSAVPLLIRIQPPTSMLLTPPFPNYSLILSRRSNHRLIWLRSSPVHFLYQLGADLLFQSIIPLHAQFWSTTVPNVGLNHHSGFSNVLWYKDTMLISSTFPFVA